MAGTLRRFLRLFSEHRNFHIYTSDHGVLLTLQDKCVWGSQGGGGRAGGLAGCVTVTYMGVGKEVSPLAGRKREHNESNTVRSLLKK